MDRNNNLLLTISQVADRWKVSRMTVYRMLDDKTLLGIKIGNQWRIEIDELLRIENSGKTPTQEQRTHVDDLVAIYQDILLQTKEIVGRDMTEAIWLKTIDSASALAGVLF